jgi:hypothetical protein
MTGKKKIIVELMVKSRYCLICDYMDKAVSEILPEYEEWIQYRRIDILESEGRKRFLDLSIALFGEEGVYKEFRVAPVPSMFINGELFFEVIPPRPVLEEAFEKVISEHNLRGSG